MDYLSKHSRLQCFLENAAWCLLLVSLYIFMNDMEQCFSKLIVYSNIENLFLKQIFKCALVFPYRFVYLLRKYTGKQSFGW